MRRGEKVNVDVNVLVEGDAAPGTLVTQDANTIADRGRGDVHPRAADRCRSRAPRPAPRSPPASSSCPRASRLIVDPETLVVNVVAAPTAEDLESDGAGEATEAAASGRGEPTRPQAEGEAEASE